ncbi:MAG: YkgJ family cysteine cluster protein [Chloroflexota bacterium]|nr:YkgJ family cysteine cluster protein [Chloroflexota bacterium]
MMKELPMAALAPNTRMSGDEEQEAMGLRYGHQQINTLAQAIFAASVQAAALGNLLQARGLITHDELVAQRAVEEERLTRLFQEKKVGVRLEDEVLDKYAIPPETLPQIDCAARYHLCRGACCALIFPLSLQDVEEGVVRWEYGQPYMIRHGEDDRCVHQDRGTGQCTIYEQRPAICRTYDCRHDARIWQDFEQGIINPNLVAIGPDGQERLQFPRKSVQNDGATDGDKTATIVPESY